MTGTRRIFASPRELGGPLPLAPMCKVEVTPQAGRRRHQALDSIQPLLYRVEGGLPQRRLRGLSGRSPDPPCRDIVIEGESYRAKEARERNEQPRGEVMSKLSRSRSSTPARICGRSPSTSPRSGPPSRRSLCSTCSTICATRSGPLWQPATVCLGVQI
jgi:hypothetical protein